MITVVQLYKHTGRDGDGDGEHLLLTRLDFISPEQALVAPFRAVVHDALAVPAGRPSDRDRQMDNARARAHAKKKNTKRQKKYGKGVVVVVVIFLFPFIMT